MVWSGEHDAWDILLGLDSEDIETNAGVSFDSHGSSYELTCLGQEICVSVSDRIISGNSCSGKLLVETLGEYSRLSILRYLIHAIDLPLSGQLVVPGTLPGGDIFTRGTHVLPLDKLASCFSNSPVDFLSIGKRLGGRQLDHGDMSLELFPFPRIPVVLIVWSGDDEFPPNSSLLFDSSCKSHLSTDIMWSTAMMAVEMMLLEVR